VEVPRSFCVDRERSAFPVLYKKNKGFQPFVLKFAKSALLDRKKCIRYCKSGKKRGCSTQYREGVD